MTKKNAQSERRKELRIE